MKTTQSVAPAVCLKRTKVVQSENLSVGEIARLYSELLRLRAEVRALEKDRFQLNSIMMHAPGVAGPAN